MEDCPGELEAVTIGLDHDVDTEYAMLQYITVQYNTDGHHTIQMV